MLLASLHPSRPHQVNRQRDKTQRTDAQQHKKTDLNAAHGVFPRLMSTDRQQQ
jgi:hypothetical protein